MFTRQLSIEYVAVSLEHTSRKGIHENVEEKKVHEKKGKFVGNRYNIYIIRDHQRREACVSILATDVVPDNICQSGNSYCNNHA